MHREVTLFGMKSSNKLKYLKLEERKSKTAKELVTQFWKIFPTRKKKFRVIYIFGYLNLNIFYYSLKAQQCVLIKVFQCCHNDTRVILFDLCLLCLQTKIQIIRTKKLKVVKIFIPPFPLRSIFLNFFLKKTSSDFKLQFDILGAFSHATIPNKFI